MIKFEDLKIGDSLKNVFSGLIFEVIAVGPSDILLGGANMPTRHESILSWVPCNWFCHTPPKQKKVRLMSPAVMWVSLGGQGHLGIGSWLYETEADAKKSIAKELFHSWPAKDANGNAIQYQVEVEE